MILYLDTSALLKMYVEEEDAQRVRNAVTDAKLVGTVKSHTLNCIGATLLRRLARAGGVSTNATRR